VLIIVWQYYKGDENYWLKGTPRMWPKEKRGNDVEVRAVCSFKEEKKTDIVLSNEGSVREDVLVCVLKIKHVMR